MTARSILPGLCLLTLGFTGAPVLAQTGENVQVQQAWETPAELQQPESVSHDPKRDVLYVSNVSGEPPAKDGQGFISRVSPDGKILDLKWVEGMNAPKGMAIHNDKLYTADIDTLVEIDLNSGKITNRYPAPAAKFLNDVTADQAGNVYVSDMADNTIYRLSDGRFQVWLKDNTLESPNGLYAEGDHLVVGAWGVMGEGFSTKVPGHLKRVDLKTKAVSSIGGQPVGNLDGVEAADGGYFVTDWMEGKLLYVSSEGKATTLQTLKQGSADLGYVKEKKLLVIPMMNDNKLLAFTVR